ncbi:MAG TPA: 16S rRNA (adenine(1518)-N(6)/adenine(1519)-N(6))-dimethyltransferase RsmA [Candidatus Omnitrophota bacterium]|nr:16S rRNA (adenine(1518)-N(6)/adenine(1519)-N(6))-dimethyltransferase RsmA [Candidatus Omnitrophota bacterium]
MTLKKGKDMHQIQMLRKYDIRLNKVKGQNFLVDENIQKKIAAALNPQRTDWVLEIGAGLGAITDLLAGSGARIFAVEKEKIFSEILSEELGSFENLTVLNRDILKVDFGEWLRKSGALKAGQRWKVVGNLPYFITTPIVFRLIDAREAIDSALVMVQKEVADRMTAQPGGKDYGRLTLALRYYADVSFEFEVGRGCFTPVPRVDSAVVRIVFHGKRIEGLDEALMFRIIQAAFAMRRKTILNALSGGPFSLERNGWQEIFSELKIPANKRAEELHLKDYIELTQLVQPRLKKE